jgi:adenine-specific DNA methylase
VNLSPPKNNDRYTLLELFKGTGSVGKMVNKMGLNVISLDFVEKSKTCAVF